MRLFGRNLEFFDQVVEHVFIGLVKQDAIDLVHGHIEFLEQLVHQGGTVEIAK